MLDAILTGEFCVRTGHKSVHFFMSDLGKIERFARSLQRQPTMPFIPSPGNPYTRLMPPIR
jgi:hypothetical protein